MLFIPPPDASLVSELLAARLSAEFTYSDDSALVYAGELSSDEAVSVPLLQPHSNTDNRMHKKAAGFLFTYITPRFLKLFFPPF